MSEIDRVTSAARPSLGLAARHVVLLRSGSQTIVVPCGRSIGRVFRSTVAALAAIIDGSFRGAEQAAVEWQPPARPFRLSVRALLIAITVVAAVLGAARAVRWASLDLHGFSGLAIDGGIRRRGRRVDVLLVPGILLRLSDVAGAPAEYAKMKHAIAN